MFSNAYPILFIMLSSLFARTFAYNFMIFSVELKNNNDECHLRLPIDGSPNERMIMYLTTFDRQFTGDECNVDYLELNLKCPSGENNDATYIPVVKDSNGNFKYSSMGQLKFNCPIVDINLYQINVETKSYEKQLNEENEEDEDENSYLVDKRVLAIEIDISPTLTNHLMI